jgi:hypothetical protein
MGSIYLTDGPAALRARGLDVVEHPGHERRARSSGGYSDMPLCVMWHHTASNAGDPFAEARYTYLYAPAKPVCNVLLARTGQVHWCASGATNTNGAGVTMSFSRGVVAADRMNLHAFGMEIVNNGVGMRYPGVQIDAAFIISDVVNELCGNEPDDVGVHSVYAPGRKIDPARGDDAVDGDWQPLEANSSGSWVQDDLRLECVSRHGILPPPTPPVGPPSAADPMILRFAMYRLGCLLPGKPGDGVAWFRITSSTIDIEPNGNADGIDRWSGVPGGNVAGVGDFVTMFAGRRARLAGQPCTYDQYLAIVGSAWDDPTMRAAWRT